MTADRTPAMAEERVEKLARLVAEELGRQSLSHLPLTGERLASAIRRALARLDGGA